MVKLLPLIISKAIQMSRQPITLVELIRKCIILVYTRWQFVAFKQEKNRETPMREFKQRWKKIWSDRGNSLPVAENLNKPWWSQTIWSLTMLEIQGSETLNTEYWDVSLLGGLCLAQVTLARGRSQPQLSIRWRVLLFNPCSFLSPRVVAVEFRGRDGPASQASISKGLGQV